MKFKLKIMGLLVILLIVTSCTSKTKIDYPFECSPHEGQVIHVHPYLQIFIEGKKVEIPAAIGIQDPVFEGPYSMKGTCLLSMHTHDPSGIIHLESPTLQQNFTLNDFFNVWSAQYQTIKIDGKKMPITFSKDEILGFKADATHRVVLLVDNKPNTEYGNLILNYLNYCSSLDKENTNSPCYATAPSDTYPRDYATKYGTRHTIVIKYELI